MTPDLLLDKHRAVGIIDTDFNAVVEDLIRAMEYAGLSATTQNRRLAVLAPLHRGLVAP